MGDNSMWRMALAVMGIASMTIAGELDAQTQPSSALPAPTTVPVVQRTSLQAQAEATWVAPDQRIWYLGRSVVPGSPDDARQEIAQQFAEQKPTLTRSSIMLFEPQGRIWFAASLPNAGPLSVPRYVLLGFDGKDWVEHQTDYLVTGRPERSLGGAPNHISLGDRAFFSIANEIHEFDGSQWHVHVGLAVDPASRTRVITKLMPEPDGKGLIAVARNHPQIRILRWQGTEFKELALPNLPDVIRSVSPGAKGVWILTQSLLVHVPYGGETPLKQGLRGVHLGEYTASSVVQMHSDYMGRTYFLLAGMSRGGDPENGVLMEDRDGQFLPLRHPAARARCNPKFYVDPEPVVPVTGTGGELVWLPGNRHTVGPLLLDTRRGRVVHECPNIEANRLMGATRDGLLLAGGEPYSIQTKPLPRRPVTALTDPIERSVITTAGDILADVAGRLCILEAGKWRPVLGEPGLQLRYCRGAKDALLIYLPDGLHYNDTSRVALVAGARAVEAPSFAELVQQNQPLIAEYFGNRIMDWEGNRGSRTLTCVNASGDVFLAEGPEYRLRIFHNGKWLDPSDDLRKLGVPAAGIIFMAPAGDGSTVYLTASPDYIRQTAAWARLKDGSITFEIAPVMIPASRPDGFSGLRDAKGGLWIVRGMISGSNPAYLPALVRMTEAGVVEEHMTMELGQLWAIDAHNCQIMAPWTSGAEGVFVAKDGKLPTPGIRIPHMDSSVKKVLEVRPGLIWIATLPAIYELEEAEAGSGRYVLRETFRPELDLWEPQSMGVLRDGQVAIRGVKDRLTTEWRLYALAVPKQ